MSQFIQQIESAIQEEQADHDKYLILADMAPNEKAKKIILDIANEESIHKKFLMEILEECSN